jgi:hypothetical protein
MEDKDEYACSLEMKGGLNGVKYSQKFVKAPLSAHPSKAPSSGKEVPKAECMNMVMCK